jgi:transposase
MPPPRHSDMGERGVMVGLGLQQGQDRAARHPVVHYSGRTVNRWNRRFEGEGYEGLKTRPRSGRPRAVSEEDLEVLRGHMLGRPLAHLKEIVREHMPHLLQSMRTVYRR